jgi:hypothetical protein
MRVKITYSVDFDEVPKIVNDKLFEIGSALQKCGLAVKTDVWDNNHVQILESIDSVRKQLAGLDAQLEDCYSILAGYNKALADMKLPAQEQHEQQTGEG